MKNILATLNNGLSNFESSSTLTPEFKKFFTEFKKEIKKELSKVGATEFELTRGHFYCSGFFKAFSGQLYYISLSDVRHDFLDPTMLIRTAKNNKDFSGGSNNYIRIETDMFLKNRLP